MNKPDEDVTTDRAAPPYTVQALRATFLDGTESLRAAFQGMPEATAAEGHSPAAMLAGVLQWFDVLQRIEHDREVVDTLDPDAISELGDYGFDLLEELSLLALQRGLTEDAQTLLGLGYPVALWVVEHGGQLRRLQLMVNALAECANHLWDPQRLALLCERMTRLVAAVDTRIFLDPDNADVRELWSVLLLNYGIVATRSHQPALIERAYGTLVDHLPGEARDFFREGMRQMEALDYPPQVRSIVQRYFVQWGGDSTRH